MTDNEHNDTDYLALWILAQGIQITGQCAFCDKYADLVSTSADDLVCADCKDEFEVFMETGDTDHDPR